MVGVRAPTEKSFKKVLHYCTRCDNIKMKDETNKTRRKIYG